MVETLFQSSTRELRANCLFCMENLVSIFLSLQQNSISLDSVRLHPSPPQKKKITKLKHIKSGYLDPAVKKKKKYMEDTFLGMTKQTHNGILCLCFTELSLHCVKTLKLTTAALLSHSSKVFNEIRLFCQIINSLPLWMMSVFKKNNGKMLLLYKFYFTLCLSHECMCARTHVHVCLHE